MFYQSQGWFDCHHDHRFLLVFVPSHRCVLCLSAHIYTQNFRVCTSSLLFFFSFSLELSLINWFRQLHDLNDSWLFAVLRRSHAKCTRSGGMPCITSHYFESKRMKKKKRNKSCRALFWVGFSSDAFLMQPMRMVRRDISLLMKCSVIKDHENITVFYRTYYYYYNHLLI